MKRYIHSSTARPKASPPLNKGQVAVRKFKSKYPKAYEVLGR